MKVSCTVLPSVGGQIITTLPPHIALGSDGQQNQEVVCHMASALTFNLVKGANALEKQLL